MGKICCIYPTGHKWTQSKYGKYIKVNSTGIKRRRKALARGTKMAPQGRPPLWKWSEHSIPLRKVKEPKKAHDLTNNILLNQRMCSTS